MLESVIYTAMEYSTGNTIGARVHYYRTKAKFSQMELEIAIKAAPGSISRIENGKVNPTKETLLGIATQLSLRPKEVSDLLGIRRLYPTREEIAQAVEEVEDYLNNSNTLGYLIDDWIRLIKPSKGLVNLLGLSEADVQPLIGRSLLEIFFDPVLKVRPFIDPGYFGEMMLHEILRVDTEIEGGLEQDPLFGKLKQLPDFPELWEGTRKLPPDRMFIANNKVARLNLDGQEYKLIYVFEKLKNNDRFEVVDFLPLP